MNSIRHNYSIGKSAVLRALALAGLILMTALPVTAAENTQYDDVYINGYKLGYFEQMALEDHINRDIPNGNYWFDMETGMWGPVGGPAIGTISVPEEYREYVETRLNNKKGQAAQVDFAESEEECKSGCLFW